jgi:hypothetical protein
MSTLPVRDGVSTRTLILAATLLLCVSTAPDTGSTGLIDSFRNFFNWSFDGQAYLYGEGLARTPNSLLNPGNSTVHLANLTLTGELRPNAQATSQYLDITLQPRLTTVYQNGGVDEEEALRGYFRQAFGRVKPVENVSVTAGRELLTWGPAFFRSPSNPFYFNNARIDPIRELPGIDLVRVSYAPTSNWNITAGGVLDSGHDLVANDSYRDAAFVKVDYRANDYLGSLVVAGLQGESAFVGGYAQATVNDAILLYGEFGSSSSRTGLDIQPVNSLSQFNPSLESGREATALLGGSYTFENGQSIYAEYLYNGFGYSNSNERRYFNAARLANAESVLGYPLAGLAAENIGYAATRANDLLGQHYLYLQYQNNPSQGGTIWRIMAAENLVDHSAQLSFYLEQNVTDRISLFALGLGNIGPHSSEFGSLFRESITVGLKVFLF